jgi:hypothetical protein
MPASARIPCLRRAGAGKPLPAGSSTPDNASLPVACTAPLASPAAWTQSGGILLVPFSGPSTLRAGTPLALSFTLTNPVTAQPRRTVTVAVIGVTAFPSAPVPMTTDTTSALPLLGSVVGDAAVLRVRTRARMPTPHARARTHTRVQGYTHTHMHTHTHTHTRARAHAHAHAHLVPKTFDRGGVGELPMEGGSIGEG